VARLLGCSLESNGRRFVLVLVLLLVLGITCKVEDEEENEDEDDLRPSFSRPQPSSLATGSAPRLACGR